MQKNKEKTRSKTTKTEKNDIRPEQSIALLKALHILTRDGQLNQDSRRKLKQIYHLYQFIEPLLKALLDKKPNGDNMCLVDHGAGKSYLGFILYDLFFKQAAPNAQVIGIETRTELVEKSRALATELGFAKGTQQGMRFLPLSVADSITSDELPATVDIVTALHACNTATDDAIRFALEKQAQSIVLVPCCQAEVASLLRQLKAEKVGGVDDDNPLGEIWRRPLHTREFGSHLTNVLRCLQLEAHGYQVTVTELVGWEHSMKNELIIATKSAEKKGKPNRKQAERLQAMLSTLGLQDSLSARFYLPTLN
ncbi:class I SAM-dependent methyltransferase [Parvibium lacunae]|uniref:SAM-dependent methyltransferase n=1 Tax=Parvibium lacunae TaxID=1888893 RepID=A0A368L8D2_9BURK|nr:SAM-dependent methyltransferase [Parvibium lacunae]RCS59958.1 SAM-dependent methyltransferase [Parvibium lacunae]